ncbi:uncharacterized protein LOC135922655 isoform X2 [Gordionus sp. m RMFG-2023]|uniref:uncharacterized protein LOC135922655 isoform X2 n=1 Tax=Gordionus sp. m RMFG-2023 TaxID=3053472 RepID=UPI0031FD87FA
MSSSNQSSYPSHLNLTQPIIGGKTSSFLDELNDMPPPAASYNIPNRQNYHPLNQMYSSNYNIQAYQPSNSQNSNQLQQQPLNLFDANSNFPVHGNNNTVGISIYNHSSQAMEINNSTLNQIPYRSSHPQNNYYNNYLPHQTPHNINNQSYYPDKTATRIPMLPYQDNPLIIPNQRPQEINFNNLPYPNNYTNAPPVNKRFIPVNQTPTEDFTRAPMVHPSFNPHQGQPMHHQAMPIRYYNDGRGDINILNYQQSTPQGMPQSNKYIPITCTHLAIKNEYYNHPQILNDRKPQQPSPFLAQNNAKPPTTIFNRPPLQNSYINFPNSYSDFNNSSYNNSINNNSLMLSNATIDQQKFAFNENDLTKIINRSYIATTKSNESFSTAYNQAISTLPSQNIMVNENIGKPYIIEKYPLGNLASLITQGGSSIKHYPMGHTFPNTTTYKQSFLDSLRDPEIYGLEDKILPKCEPFQPTLNLGMASSTPSIQKIKEEPTLLKHESDITVTRYAAYPTTLLNQIPGATMYKPPIQNISHLPIKIEEHHLSKDMLIVPEIKYPPLNRSFVENSQFSVRTSRPSHTPSFQSLLLDQDIEFPTSLNFLHNNNSSHQLSTSTLVRHAEYIKKEPLNEPNSFMIQDTLNPLVVSSLASRASLDLHASYRSPSHPNAQAMGSFHPATYGTNFGVSNNEPKAQPANSKSGLEPVVSGSELSFKPAPKRKKKERKMADENTVALPKTPARPKKEGPVKKRNSKVPTISSFKTEEEKTINDSLNDLLLDLSSSQPRETLSSSSTCSLVMIPVGSSPPAHSPTSLSISTSLTNIANNVSLGTGGGGPANILASSVTFVVSQKRKKTDGSLSLDRGSGADIEAASVAGNKEPGLTADVDPAYRIEKGDKNTSSDEFSSGPAGSGSGRKKSRHRLIKLKTPIVVGTRGRKKGSARSSSSRKERKSGGKTPKRGRKPKKDGGDLSADYCDDEVTAEDDASDDEYRDTTVRAYRDYSRKKSEKLDVGKIGNTEENYNDNDNREENETIVALVGTEDVDISFIEKRRSARQVKRKVYMDEAMDDETFEREIMHAPTKKKSSARNLQSLTSSSTNVDFFSSDAIMDAIIVQGDSNPETNSNIGLVDLKGDFSQTTDLAGLSTDNNNTIAGIDNTTTLPNINNIVGDNSSIPLTMTTSPSIAVQSDSSLPVKSLNTPKSEHMGTIEEDDHSEPLNPLADLRRRRKLEGPHYKPEMVNVTTEFGRSALALSHRLIKLESKAAGNIHRNSKETSKGDERDFSREPLPPLAVPYIFDETYLLGGGYESLVVEKIMDSRIVTKVMVSTDDEVIMRANKLEDTPQVNNNTEEGIVKGATKIESVEPTPDKGHQCSEMIQVDFSIAPPDVDSAKENRVPDILLNIDNDDKAASINFIKLEAYKSTLDTNERVTEEITDKSVTIAIEAKIEEEYQLITTDTNNIVNENDENESNVEIRSLDKVSLKAGKNKEAETLLTKGKREITRQVEEFYVKFKYFSYLHCLWLDEDTLSLLDKRGASKIKRYRAKRKEFDLDLPGNIGYMDLNEEVFNQDFLEIERVMAEDVFDYSYFENYLPCNYYYYEENLALPNDQELEENAQLKSIDSVVNKIGEVGIVKAEEIANDIRPALNGKEAITAKTEEIINDIIHSHRPIPPPLIKSEETYDNAETAELSIQETKGSSKNEVYQDHPSRANTGDLKDNNKVDDKSAVIKKTMSLLDQEIDVAEPEIAKMETNYEYDKDEHRQPGEVINSDIKTDDIIPSSSTDNPDRTKVAPPIFAAESREGKIYLVKWRSMCYEDITWEREENVDKAKIMAFRRCQRVPRISTKRIPRPDPSMWRKIDDTIEFKNGNKLRDYQLEGVNWLSFCWYNRQNCILADEMGLGKTVQSITFLLEMYKAGIKGPYLILAPLSTIANWQREFEMWADLNVIVYHGSSSSRQIAQEYEMYFRDSKGYRLGDVYKFHALITTYEILMQDCELLKNIWWRVSIIDEAHRLKNVKCKLMEGIKSLKMEHRVLLTGTPLQNNIEELWSLLNFLEPVKFASSQNFLAEYGTLDTEEQVTKLQDLLRPMMLRRLKEDVEKSLAPKEETIIEVELTNIQKKYYRAILEKNFEYLAKGTSSSSNVPNLMNAMMELRKCCIHPYLIKGAEDKILSEESLTNNPPGEIKEEKSRLNNAISEETAFKLLVNSSGKLVLIDKLLPKLKANGHKVLIFSQMVRCLDLLEDYLIYKRYPFERLDGRIRGDLRQAAIDRFCKKDSDRFVFLLCTRAGGLGINLTAADTCVIFDSDWNPQNDLQAQARCHRIGQSKRVQIYRLICRNTYEREMFDRAGKKLGLDKAVLQSMRMNSAGGTENNVEGGKDFPGGLSKGISSINQLSKKEIEDLLKKGAYGALMDDDQAGDKFCEEDIEQILSRRTQVVVLDEASALNTGEDAADGTKEGERKNYSSTFAKASFTAAGNRSDIDIDDPNFWQKWAEKADIDVDKIQNKKNKSISFAILDLEEEDEFIEGDTESMLKRCFQQRRSRRQTAKYGRGDAALLEPNGEDRFGDSGSAKGKADKVDDYYYYNHLSEDKKKSGKFKKNKKGKPGKLLRQQIGFSTRSKAGGRFSEDTGSVSDFELNDELTNETTRRDMRGLEEDDEMEEEMDGSDSEFKVANEPRLLAAAGMPMEIIATACGKKKRRFKGGVGGRIKGSGGKIKVGGSIHGRDKKKFENTVNVTDGDDNNASQKVEEDFSEADDGSETRCDWSDEGACAEVDLSTRRWGRAICFRAEKGLTTYGWARWDDILRDDFGVERSSLPPSNQQDDISDNTQLISKNELMDSPPKTVSPEGTPAIIIKQIGDEEALTVTELPADNKKIENIGEVNEVKKDKALLSSRGMNQAKLEALCRLLILHCLKHYRGDRNIKSFMWELIDPLQHRRVIEAQKLSEIETSNINDVREEDTFKGGSGGGHKFKNHSGLSAPVPRGRKGKKKPLITSMISSEITSSDLDQIIPSDGQSSPLPLEAEWSSNFDTEKLLIDLGYRRHLQRHANKILLRVRMLYYLRSEIIGDVGEDILSGRGPDISKLSIQLPSFVDPEIPAPWWNAQADKSLLVGVFKHGYEKYEEMRLDPYLSFPSLFLPNNGSDLPSLPVSTPPIIDDCQKALRSSVKIVASETVDSQAQEQGIPEEKHPLAKKTQLDVGIDSGTTKMVVEAENGESENKDMSGRWPIPSALTSRFRRIITAYQRAHKKLLMKFEKNNEKRERLLKEQMSFKTEESPSDPKALFTSRILARAVSRLEVFAPSRSSNNTLSRLGCDWSARDQSEFLAVLMDTGVLANREDASNAHTSRRTNSAGADNEENMLLSCYEAVFDWSVYRRFHGSAFSRKADAHLEEFFVSAYANSVKTLGLQLTSFEERALKFCPDLNLNPEIACQFLDSVDLLNCVRVELLSHHPSLDKAISALPRGPSAFAKDLFPQDSAERSPEKANDNNRADKFMAEQMPLWWDNEIFDREMLIGVACHGLGNVAETIFSNPAFSFADMMKKRRNIRDKNNSAINSVALTIKQLLDKVSINVHEQGAQISEMDAIPNLDKFMATLQQQKCDKMDKFPQTSAIVQRLRSICDAVFGRQNWMRRERKIENALPDTKPSKLPKPFEELKSLDPLAKKDDKLNIPPSPVVNKRRRIKKDDLLAQKVQMFKAAVSKRGGAAFNANNNGSDHATPDRNFGKINPPDTGDKPFLPMPLLSSIFPGSSNSSNQQHNPTISARTLRNNSRAKTNQNINYAELEEEEEAACLLDYQEKMQKFLFEKFGPFEPPKSRGSGGKKKNDNFPPENFLPPFPFLPMPPLPRGLPIPPNSSSGSHPESAREAAAFLEMLLAAAKSDNVNYNAPATAKKLRDELTASSPYESESALDLSKNLFRNLTPNSRTHSSPLQRESDRKSKGDSQHHHPQQVPTSTSSSKKRRGGAVPKEEIKPRRLISKENLSCDSKESPKEIMKEVKEMSQSEPQEWRVPPPPPFFHPAFMFGPPPSQHNFPSHNFPHSLPSHVPPPFSPDAASAAWKSMMTAMMENETSPSMGGASGSNSSGSKKRAGKGRRVHPLEPDGAPPGMPFSPFGHHMPPPPFPPHLLAAALEDYFSSGPPHDSRTHDDSRSSSSPKDMEFPPPHFPSMFASPHHPFAPPHFPGSMFPPPFFMPPHFASSPRGGSSSSIPSLNPLAIRGAEKHTLEDSADNSNYFPFKESQGPAKKRKVRESPTAATTTHATPAENFVSSSSIMAAGGGRLLEKIVNKIKKKGA